MSKWLQAFLRVARSRATVRRFGHGVKAQASLPKKPIRHPKGTISADSTRITRSTAHLLCTRAWEMQCNLRFGVTKHWSTNNVIIWAAKQTITCKIEYKGTGVRRSLPTNAIDGDAGPRRLMQAISAASRYLPRTVFAIALPPHRPCCEHNKASLEIGDIFIAIFTPASSCPCYRSGHASGANALERREAQHLVCVHFITCRNLIDFESQGRM